MENDFLEKTLEDIIFENRHNIHERGFPIIIGEMRRQMTNDYGRRVDLISVGNVNNIKNISIYELKKGKIDYNAYFQIVRYFFDICMENKKYNIGDFNIQLYLIGNEVDDEVLIAASLSNFVHIYTYKYDYDGIKFDKMSCTWDEMKEKVTKNPPRKEGFN